MQHLDAALGALIDAAVEAVVAGFDEAADAQRAMRAKGTELRQRAAAVELLGPALSKLAQSLVGEIQRHSVPRYAAMLRHVRYSEDADITELEDARRTLNSELLAMQRSPDALHRGLVMLAIIRVRAITIAVGPVCIADPKDERSSSGGPLPRRREIGPSDVSVEVMRIVTAMAHDRAGWAMGLERLAALETDAANAVGLVSSIIALAEQSRGFSYIKSIAARIERAGIDLRVDDADTIVDSQAAVPSPEPAVTSPSALAPVSTRPIVPEPERAPAPSPTPSPSMPADNRTSMMNRFGASLARAPDARALLNARHRQIGPAKGRSS